MRILAFPFSVFLCDIPKYAYKYVDGNIANDLNGVQD